MIRGEKDMPHKTDIRELRQALKLALLALNTTPRFLVPGAPQGDSYQICSELERVLRRVQP